MHSRDFRTDHQEPRLIEHIADLDAEFPQHLVLMTGAEKHRHAKRSEKVSKPHGSVFDRYQVRGYGCIAADVQFFTTPTVLAIGTAASLLFFATIALSMISSTQIPDRLGQGNRMTLEKKQQ